MCESPLALAQQAAPLQTQPRVLRRSSGFASCRASLEGGTKGFEAAVQARLYCRERDAEHAGHFVNLQFFLEAQDEHFTINRGNFLQRGLNVFLRLLAKNLVQRRGILLVRELQRMLSFWICERVQTLRFPGALPIDDQVARDGEEPGFKF